MPTDPHPPALRDLKNKVLATPRAANQEPGMMAATQSFTLMLSALWQQRWVAMFLFKLP